MACLTWKVWCYVASSYVVLVGSELALSSNRLKDEKFSKKFFYLYIWHPKANKISRTSCIENVFDAFRANTLNGRSIIKFPHIHEGAAIKNFKRQSLFLIDKSIIFSEI